MGEKTNTTFKVVLEPADSSLTGTWSMEGEGSYSSGLIDPLVDLLEKYAGEYDPNDLLGLSGYGDLYRSSLSSSFSDGRMTIQNTGEKNVSSGESAQTPPFTRFASIFRSHASG